MIGMAHTKLKKKFSKKKMEEKLAQPRAEKRQVPQVIGRLPPLHLPTIIAEPICDHRGTVPRKNNFKDEKTFSIKMHYAAEQGDMAMAKKLLHRGVDVDIRTEHLSTPLISAIMNNRLEMARFLLENGANVNARNEFGWTPLMKAALHCNGQMLELLLKHNADVNARNAEEKTVLFYALSESGSDSISLLKSLGATE